MTVIPAPPTARDRADRTARWHNLPQLDTLWQQRHLADPDRGDGHDTDGVAGDCARAVWATLAGDQLDDVPHFADYPDGYDPDTDPLVDEHGGLYARRIRRWALARFGQDVAWYDWTDHLGGRPRIHTAHGHPWTGWCAVSGDSPRGPFAHLVVGLYTWHPTGRPGRLAPTVEIVHDPHPSGAGLARITQVEVLVPAGIPGYPDPPALDDEHPTVVAVGG